MSENPNRTVPNHIAPDRPAPDHTARIVRVDPAVVENAMRAWADRFLDAANVASRAPKPERTALMREHWSQDDPADVFTHALGRPVEQAWDEALVQARVYTGRGRDHDHLATDVVHCRGCQCTGFIEVDLETVQNRLSAWVEEYRAWCRSTVLGTRTEAGTATRPATGSQALLEVLDEQLREIWDRHVTRSLEATGY